jgi:hypothetical protein
VDQPVASPLPTYRTTKTEKFMSRVGFEPTIPVFDRAKAVHALDQAATVIGLKLNPCRSTPTWSETGDEAQSVLPPYLCPLERGCSLYSNAPGTGPPVVPRVFIQYIQTGPNYQMGSLVRHPRAAPSRGYRFLRGID